MPFPLGNRWKLELNASAFSCAVLGAVGAFVEALSFVEERWGPVLGNAPTADRVSLT